MYVYNNPKYTQKTIEIEIVLVDYISENIFRQKSFLYLIELST